MIRFNSSTTKNTLWIHKTKYVSAKMYSLNVLYISNTLAHTCLHSLLLVEGPMGGGEMGVVGGEHMNQIKPHTHTYHIPQLDWSG